MSRYELTKTKYLLDEEREALLFTLEKFGPREPRNTTLIHLALFTGARAQELLNLTLADLDPYGQTVFIRGLKGSNNRELPLPPWLFNRLAALSTGTPRLFNITYVRFYQVWCEYRPCKKKLHALRHTFAIGLYRKTKDLRLVQVALGHKNIANTMIYASYQYQTEELRRAMIG